MIEPDWTYLYSFLCVARNGSLSAAARSSGLSQPTLSRHIAELERQLAVTLFDRQATGTELLQHANKMADHDLIGHDTVDRIIRHFRASGLPVERDWFTFRCDDQVVCWEMVLAGAGIGLKQRGLGARHRHLVAHFGGHSLATMPVWLTAHAELRTSIFIRCVYDFLNERFITCLNTAHTRSSWL